MVTPMLNSSIASIDTSGVQSNIQPRGMPMADDMIRSPAVLSQQGGMMWWWVSMRWNVLAMVRFLFWGR